MPTKHNRPLLFFVFGVLFSAAGCDSPTNVPKPIAPSQAASTVSASSPTTLATETVELPTLSNSPTTSPAALVKSLGFYTVDQYGDDRNVEADLAATLVRAATEKKRILLQVGGEWCGWCKLLTGFIEKNDAVRNSLEQNHLLMKVTYTQKQPNEAFLSKYPKIKGYPHLFVLDSEGKLLHSQDTSELEEGNGYNEAKMLEFLETWKLQN